jgi:predicted RNA-binding protein with PUA-like domain
MAHWLLKTEPSDYSFADLQRDKRTAWTGIANALALKNLRSMAKGDDLLIYHTGSEKSVVGTAKVAQAAKGDLPVEITPGKPLPIPVPLARIKADLRFADWGLVKIGRLSVVPTSPEQFAAILQLGSGQEK